MLERLSRSRSPVRSAPCLEDRETLLAQFAALYWAPPDSPELPPYVGNRVMEIKRFRERLVSEVEAAAFEAPVSDDAKPYLKVPKSMVVRWQRFVLYEDIARMSDVLFRGPIEPQHADDVDLRLMTAWRRMRGTISSLEEFTNAVVDFRVSAVRIAMMLETARPPEACHLDGFFELPDARTLSSLLLLRCEKDDEEELLEMYRLVCQKLEGKSCTWCGKPLDECSAAGLLDGSTLVVPSTVPKILVPQCGHAIHTVCFGTQLVREDDAGVRGCCRRCGLPYEWTTIDADPIVNSFCVLFGHYVEDRVREMCDEGQVIEESTRSIAEVCLNLARELGGLVSPSTICVLLMKRHAFNLDLVSPDSLETVCQCVLDQFLPAPPEERDRPPPPALAQAAVAGAVFGPDDRRDGSGSEMSDQERFLTEVFLPCEDSGDEVQTRVPSDDEAALQDLVPQEAVDKDGVVV